MIGEKKKVIADCDKCGKKVVATQIKYKNGVGKEVTHYKFVKHKCERS